jgi:hypothetical protein
MLQTSELPSDIRVIRKDNTESCGRKCSRRLEGWNERVRVRPQISGLNRTRRRPPTIFTGQDRALLLQGNGASPSGRMHRSFPEPYLLFPVQRPDSIDPHLLPFAFRSALRKHELAPPQKKFSGHGKRGTGKARLTTRLNATDWGGREGCPMTRACRGNARSLASKVPPADPKIRQRG